MATEESILTSFLLNSELQDNITFKQFTNLFPTSYREIQSNRHNIRETVKNNIIEECKKHEKLDLQKFKKKILNLDDNVFDGVDEKCLTIDQAIEKLTMANKNMIEETKNMKKENLNLLENIQKINEDVNDLNSRLKPISKYMIEEIKKTRKENLKLFENIQRITQKLYVSNNQD
ncbi:1215_t:CDS:2 [Entrophospora sp. SA101]|nr:1206_t:CDS:2 [Entrophospora sp. SA101]CAJ0911297.1 1215_t:CDS:2 [Entrophospora sp. SA101]